MASRRKLPPLNALRAFEAAARHVSFKAAAEELFVTSTAISHQIRHLETLIGHRLFERTPRSITLTAEGQRLFPVLRDGFDRFSQAVGELNANGHAVSLSVTPAFAAKLIVPALVDLHEAHPDIKLTVDATERLADLGRGEVDLAVRYGLPDTGNPALRCTPLVEDRYIAVAAPRWLGDRPLPLSPESLANERLLIYTWKNARMQGPTWARWMAHAGITDFDEARCIQLSEESHAIQAALDGAGVALASDVLVARDLRHHRLVQINDVSLGGFVYHCLSKKDSPKAAAIQTVETWLKGLMPAEQAESIGRSDA